LWTRADGQFDLPRADWGRLSGSSLDPTNLTTAGDHYSLGCRALLLPDASDTPSPRDNGQKYAVIRPRILRPIQNWPGRAGRLGRGAGAVDEKAPAERYASAGERRGRCGRFADVVLL